MNRTVRFPSSDIDHTTFMRVDSWSNRNNHSTDADIPKHQMSIRDRLADWWENLSRRSFIILVSTSLIVLFLIALTIVLLIVFVIHGKNHGNNPKKNNITTTSSTAPMSPTTRRLPFPAGQVIGSLSHFFPLDPVPESIQPDMRAYQYRQRFIVYGNGTLILTDGSINSNFTEFDFPLTSVLGNTNCSLCEVLAVSDACFDEEATNCSLDNSIFCCHNCTGGMNTLCYVKGAFYSSADSVIESRISRDASALILVTSSLQRSCSFTLHRIDSSAFVYDGPLMQCYISPPSSTTPFPLSQLQRAINVSSLTLDIQGATSFSYLVFVDEYGSIVFVQSGVASSQPDVLLGPVQFGITGPILSLPFSVHEDHLLAAVLQPDQFYVARLNTKSLCISILGSRSYQFHYDGELQKGSWLDDKLQLWFRTEAGPNVAVFSFSFPSDAACDYQSQKIGVQYLFST